VAVTRPSDDTVRLCCGEASAEIACWGAEPLTWRVAGRDLLWHGDPEHWSFRAPILFPVVGASKDGTVRIRSAEHPMPQHGFARQGLFRVVACEAATVRLRLTDGPDTRAAYPFSFRLDVVVRLAPDALHLGFEVTNTGPDEMPYGLGFHPAFPWPFTAKGRDGHEVVFEEAESPNVPEIAPGGLLARRTRHLPMAGRVLPLNPELFSEALVFLAARSRSFAFRSPEGNRIVMSVRNFPHLAVWSRPTAPFLSLEAWSAHADWEDAEGDLVSRPSMIRLGPGASCSHAVTLGWQPV
jgi:galactose mutarotase-like enzyme